MGVKEPKRIIKKGWQCKAGIERLTPYQSENPNPTTPTHRMKEKGKIAGDNLLLGCMHTVYAYVQCKYAHMHTVVMVIQTQVMVM